MSASGGSDSYYFTDESMIRRLHRERPVMLMGPRFVLMQAVHPLVISGLWAHSIAVEDPYSRLNRTTEVMTTIGFGKRADADRQTAAIREMHTRVKGKIKESIGPSPAGTEYRGDDPDLLMWVLFCMCDSSVAVYRHLVGPLSSADEGAYWEDMKVVGSLFGLERHQMPRTLADLDDYRCDMLESDKLQLSDWARRRLKEIVGEPPASRGAKPLIAAMNAMVVEMLPERVQHLYGYTDPAPVRRTLCRGAAAGSRAIVPLLPDRMRRATPPGLEPIQPRRPAGERARERLATVRRNGGGRSRRGGPRTPAGPRAG